MGWEWWGVGGVRVCVCVLFLSMSAGALPFPLLPRAACDCLVWGVWERKKKGGARLRECPLPFLCVSTHLSPLALQNNTRRARWGDTHAGPRGGASGQRKGRPREEKGSGGGWKRPRPLGALSLSPPVQPRHKKKKKLRFGPFRDPRVAGPCVPPVGATPHHACQPRPARQVRAGMSGRGRRPRLPGERGAARVCSPHRPRLSLHAPPLSPPPHSDTSTNDAGHFPVPDGHSPACRPAGWGGGPVRWLGGGARGGERTKKKKGSRGREWGKKGSPPLVAAPACRPSPPQGRAIPPKLEAGLWPIKGRSDLHRDRRRGEGAAGAVKAKGGRGGRRLSSARAACSPPHHHNRSSQSRAPPKRFPRRGGRHVAPTTFSAPLASLSLFVCVPAQAEREGRAPARGGGPLI